MICLYLMRKPLELTIAHTLNKYGTSALDIDNTRIPLLDDQDVKQYNNNMDCHNRYSVKGEKIGAYDGGWRKAPEAIENKGARFPSNLVLLEKTFTESQYKFFYKV